MTVNLNRRRPVLRVLFTSSKWHLKRYNTGFECQVPTGRGQRSSRKQPALGCIVLRLSLHSRTPPAPLPPDAGCSAPLTCSSRLLNACPQVEQPTRSGTSGHPRAFSSLLAPAGFSAGRRKCRAQAAPQERGLQGLFSATRSPAAVEGALGARLPPGQAAPTAKPQGQSSFLRGLGLAETKGSATGSPASPPPAAPRTVARWRRLGGPRIRSGSGDEGQPAQEDGVPGGLENPPALGGRHRSQPRGRRLSDEAWPRGRRETPAGERAGPRPSPVPPGVLAIPSPHLASTGGARLVTRARPRPHRPGSTGSAA